MTRRALRAASAVALAIALAACGAPAPPPAPPAALPPPPPPAAPAPPPPPPPPSELAFGPIVLEMTHARTPQVFHVVDELSAWYPRARRPYTEWAAKELPLGDAERATLARHAKLRARRRWGALDQAFDVDLSINEAARAAVEKKLLGRADAEAERALLDHFAPRLEPLLEAQRGAIEAFWGRVAAELPRVAPRATELARFCEMTDKLTVHTVLVADPSPSEGGSRFEGGVLVVEVLLGDDALPTFFHELFHGILMQRRGSFAVAAGKCEKAIDEETLQEGLAYAFAPGLVHPEGRDVLLEMVNADQGRSLREPSVRFARLGLALRTELAAALEGAGHESLGAFLPKACDAWAKLRR